MKGLIKRNLVSEVLERDAYMLCPVRIPPYVLQCQVAPRLCRQVLCLGVAGMPSLLHVSQLVLSTSASVAHEHSSWQYVLVVCSSLFSYVQKASTLAVTSYETGCPVEWRL